MKRHLVPYPVLLAIFPALALYSHNAKEFALTDCLPAIGMIAAAVVVLQGVLTVVIRSGRKAALILLPLLIIFFGYGHLYGLVGDARFELLGRQWGPNSFMLAGSALLVVGIIICIVRTKRDLGTLTKLLNILAVALLVVALVGVVGASFGSSGTGGTAPRAASGPAVRLTQLQAAQRPDIYYIVLDAYGRQDVLHDMYGFDNTAFIDALRRRGFYVADEGTSNYWRTGLSIPSTLNMDYLDALLPGVSPSGGISLATDLSADSRVIATLGRYGYQTVVFHSGYASIEKAPRDVYRAPRLALNEFSSGLLKTTIVPQVMYRIHRGEGYKSRRRRGQVLYTLEHLPAAADGVAQPTFVLAHIVCPHSPFVFDAEGNPTGVFREDLPKDQYRRLYLAQVRFINRRILQVVDGILARPGRESVIVLAADHGPGSEFVWDGGASRNTDAGLRERFAILSAVRVRPTLTAKLYPQITPVNSFRIILDDYLGTSLGLLPDRCYVSTESEPFRLVDVTDRVRGPGAPASRPAESDDP